MTGERTQRGLTLLEMLIALVILASITAGVGLFWGQARAWEEDNARHREVLRVERVLRLLREQWGAKRAIASEDEGDAGGEGVIVGPYGVEFTTARGVVFPRWGLVRARYGIEHALDGSYRLVYEEARVLDPRKPAAPGTTTLDPRGRPIGGRVVVMEGLSALRLERWGTREGEEPGSIRDDEDEDGDALAGAEEEVRRAGLRENDPDMEVRWRLFEDDERAAGRAVRFVGEIEGEVFSCVLVVGRSR